MDKDNKKDKDYFANFWFNEIGVNVIPADSTTKTTDILWTNDPRGNWQEEPIPEEIFEKWKSDGLFGKGLAVICGKVFRGNDKGKWLNGIDCDNKLGLDEMCPTGIRELSQNTLVEQHANKEKGHTYYLTERPIQSKSGNDGKEGTIPQIEVKSGGKFLLYCAGGNHKDGSPIEIVGNKQVKTVDAQALEERIDDICKKYEIPYLVNGKATPGKSIQEISDKNFVIHEGENRSIAILRYLDSAKSLNPSYNEDVLFAIGMQYNKQHCKPPYDEVKVRAIAKQSCGFIERENEQRKQDLKVDRIYVNKEWPDVAKKIQSMYHFVTLRETKKMWYYNENEGIYLPNADTIIEEECQKMVRSCTIKTRNEVKATIKSNGTMILGRELFDSKYINTQNGILDPKTFEPLPHSYKFLTTTKLPFAVNFEANNPKLWNHILTIIDEKDINLIMELIWICISWNNPFKKLFVFKGPPNSQKTTLSDIIVWIIGEENVSREKPLQFLAKGSRFSTSKFIGKRMNTASEISNLTKEMIENQKALVGAEKQNTERKSDNTERYFDPTKFVFLYTTNTLGAIYSSIDDNSIITRFQFIIFKNVIDEDKANGLWYEDFFDSDEDKQSAIETVVRKVIEYKKGQALKKIPKTEWSNIIQTKEILREQMPKEDKYFDEERIIRSDGDRLPLLDIKKDFESFVGYTVKEQALGIILKHHGFKSSTSNGLTYYKGWKLSKGNNETLD